MSLSESFPRVWLILFITCFILLVTFHAIPSKQARAVMHLPKPPGYLPVVGNTLLVARVQLSGRFHDWAFKNCCKWQGQPWCMHILGKAPTVFVCSPEAFEDVQKLQSEAFGKNPLFTEAAAEVLGQGIFAISGPLWQHQRKIAGRLFSPAMIQHAMDFVVPKKCAKLMDKLDDAASQDEVIDRTVSLKWLLDLFTMDVFCQVGFGVEMSGLEMTKVVAVLQSLQRSSIRIVARMLEPSWYWKMLRFLNVGAEKQLVEDMKRVNDFVYTAIARSVQEKTNTSDDIYRSSRMDLISLFLDQEAKYEPKKLRDFLISFLAAGQDTTSTAMTWFVLMINRYPKVLERVREEMKTELPDLMNGTKQVPSPEDCHGLVYLDAAIRETLRLFPVAPISGRTATRDVTLQDGTFLLKGTSVHMPHYSLGRMKTVWGSDAEEFKPERWIDPSTGKLLAVSPFKFSAFYGGPHTCLGMKFALSEIKITLAALLSRFDLKTSRDPFDYTYEMALSLRIKGGIDVVVSRLDETK